MLASSIFLCLFSIVSPWTFDEELVCGRDTAGKGSPEKRFEFAILAISVVVIPVLPVAGREANTRGRGTLVTELSTLPTGFRRCFVVVPEGD